MENCGLPENWRNMYRVERVCWIMDNWLDENGFLKPNVPEDVRIAWERIQKEDSDAWKQGIIID